MTDTKEFNKSLDRIAKALGGEEWTPEDKPEAIYKLLDKIADKLEEGAGGGGSSTSDIMYVDITSTYDETTSTEIYSATKTYNEIEEALDNGTYVIARSFLSTTSKEYMPLVKSYTYYETAYYEFANTDFTGNYNDGYYVTGNTVLINADGSVEYEYAEKSLNP